MSVVGVCLRVAAGVASGSGIRRLPVSGGRLLASGSGDLRFISAFFCPARGDDACCTARVQGKAERAERRRN